MRYSRLFPERLVAPMKLAEGLFFVLRPAQLRVPDDSGFHDAFGRGSGPRVMEGFPTELGLKLGQICVSSCEYGEICLCFLFPGLRGAVRK